VIDEHAMARAAELFFERGNVRSRRIGIGHFEHRDDAAESGGARAGFEVFLVLAPGFGKCTWVSITPGRTCRPVASNTSPAEAVARSPIAAILPPCTPTSAAPRPA